MINVITFPRLGLSFTINRAAITIGNFSIYWYGLLITFGMFLAILYGIRESKKSESVQMTFLICSLSPFPFR